MIPDYLENPIEVKIEDPILMILDKYDRPFSVGYIIASINGYKQHERFNSGFGVDYRTDVVSMLVRSTPKRYTNVSFRYINRNAGDIKVVLYVGPKIVAEVKITRTNDDVILKDGDDILYKSSSYIIYNMTVEVRDEDLFDMEEFVKHLWEGCYDIGLVHKNKINHAAIATIDAETSKFRR